TRGWPSPSTRANCALPFSIAAAGCSLSSTRQRHLLLCMVACSVAVNQADGTATTISGISVAVAVAVGEGATVAVATVGADAVVAVAGRRADSFVGAGEDAVSAAVGTALCGS